MKKSTTKLALSKHTLRNLGPALGRVRGGGDALEGLTTVIKDLTPITQDCPAKTAFCRTAQ